MNSKSMHTNIDLSRDAVDMDDTNLDYLLSMFSNEDAEITKTVYLSCDKNVYEAMDRLMDIFGDTSKIKTDKDDQNDLATIACSLLDPERLPLNEMSNIDPQNPVLNSADSFSSGWSCPTFSSAENSHFEPLDMFRKDDDKGIIKGSLIAPSVCHSSPASKATSKDSAALLSGYLEGNAKNSFLDIPPSVIDLPHSPSGVSGDWEQFYSTMNIDQGNSYNEMVSNNLLSLDIGNVPSKKNAPHEFAKDGKGPGINDTSNNPSTSLSGKNNQAVHASKKVKGNGDYEVSKGKTNTSETRCSTSNEIVVESPPDKIKIKENLVQSIISNAVLSEDSLQIKPKSSAGHQLSSQALPFIPRCIAEKKFGNSKPMPVEPKPLKPLATIKKGPGKRRKQSKEAKKQLEQSSQNSNATEQLRENQVVRSDSTTTSNSSDSGSVNSIPVYVDQRQGLLNPNNPLDPLGLNALWDKQGETFEDPKPQRNRNKSGRSGPAQCKPEQGKHNQRTPSLPPWAPAPTQPKKASHPRSFLRNDQFMTTEKSGSSKTNSQNSQVKQGNVVDLSSVINEASAEMQKFLKPAPVSHFQQSKPIYEVSQTTDIAPNRRSFRGLKSPVDIIRSYILDKQPVMVIMRGLPGSGKSHLARELVREAQKMGVMGVILSTDDFFMKNGHYIFSRNDLGDAHEWNKRRALQYARESKSPIIIDNTNTTLWELLPYAILAIEYRYAVQIFEPDTPWKIKLGELARRNTHSVDKNTIGRMKERYETLSLEKVLDEARKSLSKRRPSQQICSRPESGPSLPPFSKEMVPEIDSLLTTEEIEPSTEKVEAINSKTEKHYPLVTEEMEPSTERVEAVTVICKTGRDYLLASEEIDSNIEKVEALISKAEKDYPVVTDEIEPSTERVDASVCKTEKDCPVTTEEPSTENIEAAIYKAEIDDLLTSEEKDSSITKVKAEISKTETDYPLPTEEKKSSSDKNVTEISKTEKNYLLTTEEMKPSIEKFLKEAKPADDMLEIGRGDGVSDLPMLTAQDTTSSESFWSCASDFDALSGKSGDQQEKFEDAKSLLLLDEMYDPILQGFANCEEDVEPDSKTEPVTPATVVGDNKPPFLNILQEVPISDFSVGPRASSPIKIMEGEKDIAFEMSSYAKDLKVSDNRTQNDVSDLPIQSCDDPYSVGLIDISDVRNPTSAYDKTPAGIDSDRKVFSGELFNKLFNPESLGGDNIQQKESTKKRGSDQISLPSLVAYSDSDSSSDVEASENSNLPEKEKQLENSPLREECDPNGKAIADATTENATDDLKSSGEQSPEATQSSGVTSSDKEGSPRPLTALKHDILPKKKKRVRVRQGREQPPFLDKSLKEKSKQENWGSFFIHSPGNASLDNLIVGDKTEHSEVETQSASCQCQPYIFCMVHKLNSPSFKTLQPVDDAAVCDDGESGLKILNSSTNQTTRLEMNKNNDHQSQKMEGQPDTKDSATFPVPRKSETTDRSTSTDDSLNQEQIDLQTLHRCFPEYSSQQLEEVMAICHNDLEWVTSHLLDSPALIDQDEGSDKEEKDDDKNGVLVPRNVKSTQPLGFDNPKSLAELSRAVVKGVSHVDSDDLEMQVIQAGQSRLQRIERHHWSRQHSSSTPHRQDALWSSDVRLEDFTGTVEPVEFWEWNQSPKSVDGKKTRKKSLSPFQQQYRSVNAPSSVSPLSGRSSYLSSLMSEKKFSGPLMWQVSDEEGSCLPEVGPMPSNDKGSDTATVTKLDHAPSSKPVVSRELIHCLEKMFGPLGLTESQDLQLDDQIAHKVYNCLKLQVSHSKVVASPSSFHMQVQNDEALAKALQEEENLKNRSGTASSMGPPSQVPGWTSDPPSWMLQNLQSPQKKSFSQSQMNLANSVSGTLHHLRGTSAVEKPTPYKLKHRQLQSRAMTSARGSVWAGSRTGTGRRPDSLHSIIAEEQAAESIRQEQLQTLGALGEDLSTKIKRSKLSELFPTLPPDLLEEVFMQSNYSLEKTINVLETAYNLSPAPGAEDVEEAMLRKAVDLSRKQVAPQPKTDDEDLSYLCEADADMNTVTYDDLRAEAQTFRGLAKECQEQANRHHREGLHGAALFYRQRAKKYKEEEYDANHRAADFLFDKGSERLDRENTLDLHFYHLDEAVMAVNKAIAMKEEDRRLNPCKKNSYLNVVTGRGRNSKGGIPRLKPAIINHLMDRSLPFEEKSPGMLKVHIGQRL